MILVVSSSEDAHARAVMAKIREAGGVARLLDLSSFPSQSELTIAFAPDSIRLRRSLRTAAETLELDRCGVVWWRRPQPLSLHGELRSVEGRNFALTEAHSALSGLWMTLDSYWINHPTNDDIAARKLFQLHVARKVGLRIPATCVTNSVAEARQFVARRGPEGTVYKAFAGTERSWRETRLLRLNELDLIENVKYAPVIFQEYVPAMYDLRVTVVGERLFPAAIYSQETDYKVDFRMNMHAARFEAVELPRDIVALLHEFMGELGLVYGAIDMRRTPGGEYVFLEVNPAGQWLFVEERTGQLITGAMADHLMSHDGG